MQDPPNPPALARDPNDDYLIALAVVSQRIHGVTQIGLGANRHQVLINLHDDDGSRSSGTAQFDFALSGQDRENLRWLQGREGPEATPRPCCTGAGG